MMSEARPGLLLVNRQRTVRLVALQRVEKLAEAAFKLCQTYPGASDARLADFEQVEVAAVSDRVIADVHRRFMNILGATDVITFAHGEIVVSAETAAREAVAQGETTERELLRYIVHGLLHLNGHEDSRTEEAATMWIAQEAVLEQLWPE